MKISVADFEKICDCACFYMFNPITTEEKELTMQNKIDKSKLFIDHVISECGMEGVVCYIEFDLKIWKNSEFFY